jgi:hypothetical protein
VTPNALFFKRNHLPVPDVKEEDYLLEVERREEGREGGREGQVVEVEGEDGKEREGRQEWKCMGGMVRNRHLR